LYVDDIFIVNQYKDERNELKGILNSKFEMDDLGPARQIL